MADDLNRALEAFRSAKGLEKRRDVATDVVRLGELRRGAGHAAASQAAEGVRADLTRRDAPVGGREGFSEREKIEMKMALRKLQAEIQQKAAEIRADLTKSEVDKRVALASLAGKAFDSYTDLAVANSDNATLAALKRADLESKILTDQADAVVGGGGAAGGAGGGGLTLAELASINSPGGAEVHASRTLLQQHGGDILSQQGPAAAMMAPDVIAALNQSVLSGTPVEVVRTVRAHEQAAGVPEGSFDAVIRASTPQEATTTIRQIADQMTANGAPPAEVNTFENMWATAINDGAIQFGHPTLNAMSGRLEQAKTEVAGSAQLVVERGRLFADALDAAGGARGGANMGVAKAMAEAGLGVFELLLDPAASSEASAGIDLGMPDLGDIENMIDTLPTPEAPLTDSFSIKQRIMASPKFQQDFSAHQGDDPEAFFQQRIGELAVQARQSAAANVKDKIIPGPPRDSIRDVRNAAGETIAGQSNQLTPDAKTDALL